jgi:type II secretory pathway component GspD/PulD (secretin)/tetratricopeptide (TPR) repeat protein
MTKAAILFLGLAAVIALPAVATAQDSPAATAVNEAVLRQANKIVLQQKLLDARRASQAGETVAAAKLYQESCELAQQIGSGVDAETAQAINGLSVTRLTLARDAQAHGDLHEAGIQAQQVLKADPKNPAALAFKKQNDQMIAARKGRMASPEVLEQVPQVAAQKLDAKTYVQNGKLLYEMGKLNDAEAQLNQAVAIDPDNAAAFYYMNLIQQARFTRENTQHNENTQERMTTVEKQWILPANKNNLTAGNPYATNQLVYTGPGRQAIVSKLDHIRLDSVSFDGLPLSEVLRNLSEQSRLRDPQRKGINFLINPNPDLSGQAIAAPTATGLGGGFGGGFGGVGGVPGAPAAAPMATDPATGQLLASAPGGGEAVDVGSFIVKIPNLSDVRLADVLDAIVMVADHPIKYTVTDFAIVFSSKGAETPQLFTRVFKVDPNTFYSGLESVGSASFGSVSSSGSSSGGGGNSGGGNSGGGGNNQNNGGAVVGVVNAFSGAGGLRNTGNGQGGGGGGGQGQGSVNPLAAGGGGGGGNVGGNGGLNYITQVTLAETVSAAARAYFTALGVNLSSPPGKAVFFNDRVGKLFVKATEQDLDTIERAIEMLDEVAPQVHIKSRFIEVQQDDNKALGFDWYLGQFNMTGNGSVVGSGGTSPSLGTGQVPGTSAANPLGLFPGNTAASVIPGAATDQQLFSSGSGAPTVATLTGILTDPNFRMVIHALQTRTGSETLGEPEVTTTSGRQTQMRATAIQNVVTGFSFDNGTANNGGGGNSGGNSVNSVVQAPGVASVSPSTQQVEIGPILDVVPYVLSDGYTINLALIPSDTEFLGYDTISASEIPGYNPGSSLGNLNGTTLPVALPKFSVRQVVTTVNVWDNQTVVLGGLISSSVQSSKSQLPVIGDLPLIGRLFQNQSKTTQKKNLMIFVTATIVDPAGNRVHTDDDLPFAQAAIPAQPPGLQKISPPVAKE